MITELLIDYFKEVSAEPFEKENLFLVESKFSID